MDANPRRLDRGARPDAQVLQSRVRGDYPRQCVRPPVLLRARTPSHVSRLLRRPLCQTVLPTRAAHPRDKAKVETAVQIVELEVLALLRHEVFRSMADLQHVNTRVDQ